ncbi:FecR domain-containing protein [Pantoea sp. 18069]|uniref:FecR domain-containing protein n=1 Tax=Pantoea sp. 18069 TaxID=2681415 RepID=UPI001359BC03|nr:FecR domain-containing protein [Pantoea sp. 18069]
MAASVQATPLMVDGLIAHRVAPGDTLEQIARQYLGDHRLWPELQSFNRVANPLHLQPGFTLRFPDRLLRLATASVEYVRGEAVAITPARRSSDSQTPAGAAQRRNVQAGEVLQEGEQLQLAANAFVSVRLADGSLVRVQAQSDVQLQQMRRRGRAGSLQSVLDLHSGALDASVTREPADQRHFEIRTPVASTSVRGTRFHVQADATGRTITAVDEGSVAVASAAAQRPNASRVSLLEAGQGLAVTAQAAVGAPTALLPAPDLAQLPERYEDAHWLDIIWPAISNARSYQLQVARDAQFSAVVRSAASDTPQQRFAALEDGDYFLALRAIDAQGIPGRLAQRSIRIKSQPVPPLYQTPAAAGVLAQGAGALQCTTVPGAIAYRIQVAGAAGATGFAQPLLDSRVDGECRLSVDALPAGDYQWRAASIRSTPADAADQGPFAAGQAFTVATPPPTLAADELALGNQDGTAQLSWPGQPGQSYRLMVASDLAFADVQHDALLQEPRWAANTLAPGRYYVQLQVIDSNGLRSRFSAAREFAAGNTVRDGSGQRLRTGADLPLHRQ